MWFKPNDLRVQDHAPLLAAHTECATVDHVFFFDPRSFRTTALGNTKCGPRRFAWTGECLIDLQQTLGRHGSTLQCYIGRPERLLPALMASLGASVLYTHSDVTEEELTVQRSVVSALGRSIVVREWWGGGTLLEPGNLPFNPRATLPFFTAFRKQVEATKVLATLQPGPPFPPPGGSKPPRRLAGTQQQEPSFVATSELQASGIDALYLRVVSEGRKETECFRGGVGGCTVSPVTAEPSPASPVNIPRAVDARAAFALPGGETCGHQRIAHYITQGQGRLSVYKETRNGLVGLDYSSKLSPYLASGCVTARQVLRAIYAFEASPGGVANESTYWLVFELLWRDYMRFYALRHGKRLFHLGGPRPDEGKTKWPWRRNAQLFACWALGRTGYPVIDAHMRELLLTGFMSNRGRQIVASFLVRDLELDWRLGAEHFEACLVDHDVCSNWGNWQYAAGVGADPREDRYFNIVKQAKDYDPEGTHIRLWLPEAARVPVRLLLDVRLLTPQLRQQLDVSMLPEPICSLMMDRSPQQSAGGDGKQRAGGKRNHQHGFVPGRK